VNIILGRNIVPNLPIAFFEVVTDFFTIDLGIIDLLQRMTLRLVLYGRKTLSPRLRKEHSLRVKESIQTLAERSDRWLDEVTYRGAP
jgi:hypothetical protein